MKTSHVCAERARERKQQRQAKCYNRKATAKDIEAQLEHEGTDEFGKDIATAGAATVATAAPVYTAVATGSRKREARTTASQEPRLDSNIKMVDIRRRKRRNEAGQYVLDFELRPFVELDPVGQEPMEAKTLASAGSRPENTMHCSKPTESWKTLYLEKACNRAVARKCRSVGRSEVGEQLRTGVRPKKIGCARIVRAMWRAAKMKTGGAKWKRAQFGIGGVEHNQLEDRGCTGDTSDATEPYDRVRY
ncbi:uncharacterized protein PITG_16448 [Phytophthora infestans T30-4]|uniref:Uncharacterized protein n=1 Tax=Phytophthora infestans (strain T30-4) TaxID=403677 RepID=D0NTN3_PHYIT|nr:uncharacterized protein PITG_16448 [Phytophthora infestans T30-4]EEY64995.1 hypothetical protein PITG_16448 [Phytophthora infestans T30-4]|eukprot:XP_002897483.1 hypothetical protein PITG_16448 [Phytophthora infestans T30-4]